MEVYLARLPKQNLARMPAADRKLFLVLGHLSNEVNVMQKLMLMLRRDDPPSRAIDLAEAGQVMIVMRVLIGKLHEAYRVFNEMVQGDAEISERYGIRAGWKGQDKLKELNRHFKKRSLLTGVRQKIAFHYVDEDNLIEKSFRGLPDEEPWELYLSDTVGNTFYYASEMVVMKAALDLVEIEPVEGRRLEEVQLEKLFDVTLAVARLVMELSHDLLIEVLERSGTEGLEMEPVELGPLRAASEISLPFFTGPENSKPEPRTR